MPIALITNYLPSYRLPLYRLLHQRYGVEVHCFGGEAHYVPESLKDLDRQIAAAPFPAHRLDGQRQARAVAEESDAVISVIAGRVALPVAYRAARRAKTPFVLWASLWRHPLTLPHTFSLPLMRRIYRRAGAIVTYGPHVSRYVGRYRRSMNGIFVAPQAVEPWVFGRQVPDSEQAAWRAEVHERSGLPPDTPIVLYVGRLVRDKGVEVLLRAWRGLRRGDAALCLVGDGPLAAHVGDAGPGAVHLGPMERGRLPVAYAAARAVVVPSIPTRRFLEPWGLVCNEALHQGTPVIASAAVGAVPGGLVAHGADGLVVRPGDPRELAAAIAELLDDDPLHERLAQVARTAVEPYSYEAAADAFGAALSAADEPPGKA
jgi:glycosyltransferase involved in cell wall biosynthesis